MRERGGVREGGGGRTRGVVNPKRAMRKGVSRDRERAGVGSSTGSLCLQRVAEEDRSCEMCQTPDLSEHHIVLSDSTPPSSPPPPPSPSSPPPSDFTPPPHSPPTPTSALSSPSLLFMHTLLDCATHVDSSSSDELTAIEVVSEVEMETSEKQHTHNRLHSPDVPRPPHVPHDVPRPLSGGERSKKQLDGVFGKLHRSPQPILEIKRVYPGCVVTDCIDPQGDKECAITDVTSRDFPITIDHQPEAKGEMEMEGDSPGPLSPLLFLHKAEEEEEEEEEEGSHSVPPLSQTPDITELERPQTPLLRPPLLSLHPSTPPPPSHSLSSPPHLPLSLPSCPPLSSPSSHCPSPLLSSLYRGSISAAQNLPQRDKHSKPSFTDNTEISTPITDSRDTPASTATNSRDIPTSTVNNDRSIVTTILTHKSVSTVDLSDSRYLLTTIHAQSRDWLTLLSDKQPQASTSEMTSLLKAVHSHLQAEGDYHTPNAHPSHPSPLTHHTQNAPPPLLPTPSLVTRTQPSSSSSLSSQPFIQFEFENRHLPLSALNRSSDSDQFDISPRRFTIPLTKMKRLGNAGRRWKERERNVPSVAMDNRGRGRGRAEERIEEEEEEEVEEVEEEEREGEESTYRRRGQGGDRKRGKEGEEEGEEAEEEEEESSCNLTSFYGGHKMGECVLGLRPLC